MAKLRVFVSSVQKELADERRAIRDFVHGDPLLRRFFDVFLFEDLPASGRRADKVYLHEVDRCGVYIGIFGGEYGVEDIQGVSPTEREFDRATAKGKPRLIFLKGADDRARHPKMQALVRKAGAQLIRRRFSDVADLNAAVYASLVEYLAETGGLRTKPFDAAACPEATMADLSREKVTEFLARAQAERGYALGPRTSVRKALAHLNLLDGDRPSHAAILLFGKRPQRFLITSEVKCLHFHGTEVRKPIPSYHIYKGAVFELVDQALDFVMAKVARAVVPRDGRAASDVEYELPWKAVREAIVNAVTHRDYASNASVQVMLFADRLEVWNPGELPPPLTPEKLREPHASIPRNPLIAEPMFLTRYAEKAGSGILDMLELCRENGLPEPAFRQDGGQFIQALWRPKPRKPTAARRGLGGGARAPEQPESSTSPVPVQLQSLEERIAAILRDGALPISIISKRLGQKRVSGQLKVVLRRLIAHRVIEFTIPDKPNSRLQKYRLTDGGRARLAGNER